MKNPLYIRIKSQERHIPVYVGKGLEKQLVHWLNEIYPQHAVFAIMDDHVYSIYAQRVRDHLLAHPGFKKILKFPAGEFSKNRRTKSVLEDQLLSARAGRDTVLLAMGGGVTGDLAGFVAATLHRGIPLIHVPTSLLAQVDSSIGGKVGINHQQGKNLIGAFYQPAAVFSDIRYLRTLPRDEFINGLAEVIKYAVILEPSLIDFLENHRERILAREEDTLLEIVSLCVSLKIRVVEKDEKEVGYRSILNFGHTVGHAIEKLTDYRTKHGMAVATGMRVALKLSHQLLGYPFSQVQRICRLLDGFELREIQVHSLQFHELWNAILSDKKARQQTPRFTLMRSLKEPALFYPVKQEELKYAVGG